MIKNGREKIQTEIYINKWNEGVIFTIKIKKMQMNASTIDALNTDYKVLSTVVHSRLTEYINKIVVNYQFYFRRGSRKLMNYT